MDIFDGSTRKYNAQNPQTLKNRKISCFTWQNFVSELFDSWWNPRSTISLPTSFHTFFALVRPLKCCSKYCKSYVFRILHLRLIPLVNKKGNFTKIILWKERTNVFIYELPFFYSIHNEIYIVKYEANDCENRSFIQLETRTIILHSVNLRA